MLMGEVRGKADAGEVGTLLKEAISALAGE
jgi:hypothetical protein